MSKRYRVGVVGFGVAGATAGFLLARAGHDVTLFERAPRLGPVGAGILLQPSGQEVLRRLGLLDKVAATGERVERLHALTHRGRTLVEVPYSAFEPGACAYGLHRGDLFEVLHEQVVTSGVNVRLAHDIRGCRDDGDAVFLADAAGREHGPFDFVLAADGGRSALRSCSRLPRLAYEYGYGAMWLIGRCAAAAGRLRQVTRGTTNLLGLLPMGGGRCSLFWLLHRRDKEAVWKAGLPAWRERVLALCPPAEEMFDGLTDLGRVLYTTYQHVWMPRRHDRRVLFLGDAGHAMSPHLGQGVNLALLDAYVFAGCLARAPDFRAACRAFARRRAAHLRFFSTITMFLTPFFQGGGPLLAWGRDRVLPLLPRVPWVRRQMALTMAGLKGGFLSGEMRLS